MTDPTRSDDDVNRGIGEGTILRHNPTNTLWIVVWSAIRCTVVPRASGSNHQSWPDTGPLETRGIHLDEVEFGPDQEWEVIRPIPPWERSEQR